MIRVLCAYCERAFDTDPQDPCPCPKCGRRDVRLVKKSEGPTGTSSTLTAGTSVHRCGTCGKTAIEFFEDTGRIRCISCGRVWIPRVQIDSIKIGFQDPSQ